MKNLIGSPKVRRVLLTFLVLAYIVFACWFIGRYFSIRIGSSAILFFGGVILGCIINYGSILIWLRHNFKPQLRIKKMVITQLDRVVLKDQVSYRRRISDELDEIISIRRIRRRLLSTTMIEILETDNSETWLTGRLAQTANVYGIIPLIPIKRYVQQRETKINGEKIRSIGSFSKPLNRKGRQKIGHLKYNFADNTDLHVLMRTLDNLDLYKELPTSTD